MNVGIDAKWDSNKHVTLVLQLRFTLIEVVTTFGPKLLPNNDYLTSKIFIMRGIFKALSMVGVKSFQKWIDLGHFSPGYFQFGPFNAGLLSKTFSKFSDLSFDLRKDLSWKSTCTPYLEISCALQAAFELVPIS